MLDLFDIPEAEARRDAAIAQVEAHASEEWKARALLCLYGICRKHPCFTMDELWNYIDKPHEPRASGAIARIGQKRGWMKPTDQFKPSRIPTQHRQPLRVWESFIFRGKGESL